MTALSDRELDELLRQEFERAVADDGFSARVMGALPPRKRKRSWMLPAAALAGALLAWLTLRPLPLWQQTAFEWLSGELGAASMVVCVLALGIGLLGSAWALEEAS